MTNILELTNTFEPTKANIETLAQLISEQAFDGADPIRLSIQLNALEQTCKAAREKLQEMTLNELAKSGGKTTILGAKVETAEAGVSYDYTPIEAWKFVSEKESFWTDRRKEIESLCKNCPDGSELQWTLTDTGETFTIKRAPKTSKTVAKISLGK